MSPRRGVRLVVAGAVALILAAALSALSRLPLAEPDAERSVLHLTWRLRGEEVVACRAPTEAELAELPVHMRNPDACMGEIPAFRLTVALDGQERVSRVVRPAGVRGDRPLYVYEELRVAPGRHRLEVRFEREGDEDDAGSGPPGAAAASVTSLVLSTSVELAPGQVLLVTRDASGALELRRPEA